MILSKKIKHTIVCKLIKNIKTKRDYYGLHIWSYHGTYGNMTLRREYNGQMQSFAGVLQNSYCYKFRKFHKKTLLLESLFNSFLHRCIPVKFARFLRTTFLQSTSVGCFWMITRPCKTKSITCKYFAIKAW